MCINAIRLNIKHVQRLTFWEKKSQKKKPTPQLTADTLAMVYTSIETKTAIALIGVWKRPMWRVGVYQPYHRTPKTKGDISRIHRPIHLLKIMPVHTYTKFTDSY